MKFITILCTRSAMHLMRGTRRDACWDHFRVLWPQGLPVMLNEYPMCSLVRSWSWERAREPETLSPTAK